MASPFETTVSGLLEYIATAGIATVKGVEEYNGQEFERMRQLCRERGTRAFVRVIQAQADENGPLAADCMDLQAQIVVAAQASSARTAAANAWQAAWDIYTTVRRTKAGCDTVIKEPWRLAGFKLEEQAGDCAVVWLLLAAHADFAELS